MAENISTPTTSQLPSVAIIMAVRDQAYDVEHNLPLFLQQEYEAGYQIIVVNDASSDDTTDVLKRLKATYPQFYTTFIPMSVPNAHQQRIALTIGAKAATQPWIVVADITRPPQSANSLQSMMSIAQQEDAEMVMAYRCRREGKPLRYHVWQQIDDAAPLLLKAERHSGRGHQGKRLAPQRGLYDTVAVPSSHIHELLSHYDCRLQRSKLWSCRLRTFCKCLFKHIVKS